MGDRLPLEPIALAALCRRHGIRKLSLFGSELKGTARPDSDIDLLVEFEESARPGLFDMAQIEIELSELLAEAAESALRFCQGRTRADLDTDDMLRFALTRAVEIIGEAANKVSIDARTQIPGIAWPTTG